ncbi:hypothetical protein [Aeromicrobium sp. CTD01-1L150]|uniref:hypothetical protein n=1 Tax=Aeromicrobium sp. CTD01-1L150 TaxID=3341830 RepID=UPI0035BFE051
MLSLRNSRTLSIAMIVVGVLMLLVGTGTGTWIQAVAGGLLTVVGILMSINPMVVLQDDEFQLRSPVGFTTRRFPVSGPADVRLEGNKLIHVPTGKKIASLGFGVDQSDAQKIRAWAGNQGTTD